PRRTNVARVRFAFLLVAVLILAVPAATRTGLSQRTAAAASGQEQSTTAHVTSLRKGLGAIVDEPMGRGLGTQPGIGDRFSTRGRLGPRRRGAPPGRGRRGGRTGRLLTRQPGLLVHDVPEPGDERLLRVPGRVSAQAVLREAMIEEPAQRLGQEPRLQPVEED